MSKQDAKDAKEAKDAAKEAKAGKQQYECSLTKPIGEDFTQDEIDALAFEAGKPLAECNTALTTSKDGTEHTYTVTPKGEADAVLVVPITKPEAPEGGTLIAGDPQAATEKPVE